MYKITQTQFNEMPKELQLLYEKLPNPSADEVKECFPESKTNANENYKWDKTKCDGNTFTNRGTYTPRNDSGNASRFFKSILYYPKASKSERNGGCEGIKTKKFTAGNYSQSPTCKTCNLTLNGTNDHSKCSGEVYYKEMESENTHNNHPTVKPIALMEYLIKMITPKGGTVLDPFMGSGTTGIACKKNGFDFIGIEKEEDYMKIAEARINNTKLQQKLI